MKIRIKFNKVKHQPDKEEMGISINGWSWNFLIALTDEQLRCLGIAIFRHLAKKRNKDGSQNEG